MPVKAKRRRRRDQGRRIKTKKEDRSYGSGTRCDGRASGGSDHARAPQRWP